MNKKIYKLLLIGGGTGGSVTPLLAITEELLVQKQDKFEFLWLGTKNGPEKQMVEKENIKFKAISGGKLRRYFSFKNIIDLFLILIGFFQSLIIILKFKPDLIISAGSFLSVPVVWAGWLLGVPSLIHQQDVLPGLANKLMAWFSRTITVTFNQSLADYGKKAVWTGNPVRKEIRNLKFGIGEIKEKWGLDNKFPAVLIIGGGTGAMAINNLVKQSINELTKFSQIILVSGKNKLPNFQFPLGLSSGRRPISNFQYFEFLNVKQMAEAMNLADVVVSRCGMATLTELSYLGKPAILIPIPNSHQEQNARIFRNSAIILDQNKLTPEKLLAEIKRLIDNKQLQNQLSQKISQVMKKDANQAMVSIINEILTRA